jgi:AcrR family transcriptional regulator
MHNRPPPPGRPQAPAARSRGRPSLAEAAAIDEQLLDAAFREFCRNGYGGTSMRNIAREANVSRTTLAARFANKAQLFQAIVRRQTASLALFVDVEVEGTAQLRRALITLAHRFIDRCADGSLIDIYRLISASSVQFPEVAALSVENDQTVIAHMAKIIARCAEAEGAPCRDPKIPATNFVMFIRGWALTFMVSGSLAVTGTEWVEPAIDTLLAGRAAW